MKNRFLLLLLSFIFPVAVSAQLSGPSLVGYWHNWNDVNAPYFPLDQVPSTYSVVCIAFAVPAAGTDYQMEFIPDQVSSAVLISQIQTLQARGQKVLISIGGATAPVALSNVQERDDFIASITAILSTYGFDGIDLDLEGNSLSVSGGTISNPVDAPIVNLIDAIRQIMVNYHSTNNRHMTLTMAPETAYVQGGMSAYGSIWGADLPVIEALKDSIDLLSVQLYNSGSMYGLDGSIYTQGTADFIVALTEAVIRGFQTSGGTFSGLLPRQVGVGLPACNLAAGGGYVDTSTVRSAVEYLIGNGPQPGSYVLYQPGGYPDLGGMMTWSVNWDAVSNCNGSYSYAANYTSIFGATTGVASVNQDELRIYPNPVEEKLIVESRSITGLLFSVYDVAGRKVFSEEIPVQNKITAVDVSTISPGIYFLHTGEQIFRIIKQ